MGGGEGCCGPRAVVLRLCFTHASQCLPAVVALLPASATRRVRSCLHLVLCFSPAGDAFRQRLRMFPSLVNCTTIDWFDNWPMEALTSVARSFCADLELSHAGDSGQDQAGEAALLEGVLAACVHIHQSVEAKSRRYYEELRRCGERERERAREQPLNLHCLWRDTHTHPGTAGSTT